MSELWSDDKKDLEIKAKIISECAYLPEFFPEFPDKDLPIQELNKYMDNFVEILTDKAETVYSTNREKNIVRVFFTIYWKKLSSNPKVKMYCISYLCAEYFRKSNALTTSSFALQCFSPNIFFPVFIFTCLLHFLSLKHSMKR